MGQTARSGGTTLLLRLHVVMHPRRRRRRRRRGPYFFEHERSEHVGRFVTGLHRGGYGGRRGAPTDRRPSAVFVVLVVIVVVIAAAAVVVIRVAAGGRVVVRRGPAVVFQSVQVRRSRARQIPFGQDQRRQSVRHRAAAGLGGRRRRRRRHVWGGAGFARAPYVPGCVYTCGQVYRSRGVGTRNFVPRGRCENADGDNVVSGTRRTTRGADDTDPPPSVDFAARMERVRALSRGSAGQPMSARRRGGAYVRRDHRARASRRARVPYARVYALHWRRPIG